MGILFLGIGSFIVACIAYSNHRDSEHHDHKLFVVTIPDHHLEDEEVRRIKERYHKESRKAILVSIALLFIFFFITSPIGMTVCFIIWILVAFKIMSLPFVHANHAMKKLKAAQHWISSEQKMVHIDTTISLHLHDAMLKPYIFGIPLLIEVFNFLFMKETRESLMSGLIILNILIMVLGYYFIHRLPSRTYCDDSTLNIAINRNRRYYYSVFLFLLVLESSLMNMFMAGMSLVSWGNLPFILIMEGAGCVLFLILVFSCFKQMRKQEDSYMAQMKSPYLTPDEDDYWDVCMFGLYYSNPYDHAFFKSTPSGMQVTFNMAKPAAKIIGWIFAILLILFFAILFGYPYYLSSTKQIVDVQIHNHTVVIDSPFYEKEIPMKEIHKALLLKEAPKGTRVAGTDTGSYAKGKYKLKEYGDCTLYIAADYLPYILVETEQGTILFNDDDRQHTEEIYKQIQTTIESRDPS